MPRRSSIETLPSDILERLRELLRDKRITQLEVTRRINDALSDAGHDEQVTKSSVNRYAVKMEKIGAKLRESREVAEMWVGKFGAAPQGQMGNLINEMLRTLSFDLTVLLEEGGVTQDNAADVAAMLKNLALTSMRLEKAATLNVKREDDIRRQERERAAEEVGEAAKSQGLGEEQADFLRRRVLGIG